MGSIVRAALQALLGLRAKARNEDIAGALRALPGIQAASVETRNRACGMRATVALRLEIDVHTSAAPRR